MTGLKRKDHPTDETDEQSPKHMALTLPTGYRNKKNYVYHETSPLFKIDQKLFPKLFAHQLIGLQWMYSLTKTKVNGGILADDMGLGKTCQICSFTDTMFNSNLATSAMFLVPTTTLANWKTEIKKWMSTKEVKVFIFHGAIDKSPKIIEICDRILKGKKTIVISTPQTITIYVQKFTEALAGKQFDIVALDEAQVIKNSTAGVSRKFRDIPCRTRIAMTGTPVSNCLTELWAIYEWICASKLDHILGTKRAFVKDYAKPISESLKDDADSYVVFKGKEKTNQLCKLIDKYYLRRDKSTTMTISSNANTIGSSAMTLSQKNDFIVWVQLTPMQQLLYTAFTKSPEVKKAIMRDNSTYCLPAMQSLRSVCNSVVMCRGFEEIAPYLENNNDAEEMVERLKEKWALEEKNAFYSEFSSSSSSSETDDDLDDNNIAPSRRKLVNEAIAEMSIQQILAGSTKIATMLDLVKSNFKDGHRTLIFSQWTTMLDMAEKVLSKHVNNYRRIDGSTSTGKRQRYADEFNTDFEIACMLISTKAGGIGLNLIGADRVIILDPSWNPTSDDQAADRCYRIGQKKNVIIYRLVSCGTIEEKVYAKQIFKKGLENCINGTDSVDGVNGAKGNAKKYCSTSMLSELLGAPKNYDISDTQIKLEKQHTGQRRDYTGLKQYVTKVTNISTVFGISDHNLLYNEDNNSSVDTVEKPSIESLYPMFTATKQKKKTSLYKPAFVFTQTSNNTVRDAILIEDEDIDLDLDQPEKNQEKLQLAEEEYHVNYDDNSLELSDAEITIGEDDEPNISLSEDEEEDEFYLNEPIEIYEDNFYVGGFVSVATTTITNKSNNNYNDEDEIIILADNDIGTNLDNCIIID